MKTRDRNHILACGMLLFFCAGIFYGWSIFVEPLEMEFGWSRSETSLVFTISLIAYCVGTTSCGLLLKKFSPRVVFTLSSAFILCGFYLSSICTSLLGLYFGYGVLYGIAAGLTYICCLTTVCNWFPEKSGKITGWLSMSYGLGAFILSSVAGYIIEVSSFRLAFRIIGIFMATFVFIAGFIITNPKPDEIPKVDIPKELLSSKEYTTKEMLHSKSFYYFFTWATLIGTCGMAAVGNASPMASSLGASIGLTVFATGLFNIFNSFSRLAVGTLNDRIGYTKILTYINIISIIGLALLTVAFVTESIPLFMLSLALVSMGYGGNSANTAIAVRKFYGNKDYAMNSAIMFLDTIPMALIGPGIAAYIYESSGSYTPVCLVLLAIAALQLVIKHKVVKP